MNNSAPHDSIPWAEFPQECFIYLQFMAIFQLIIFAFVSVLLIMVPPMSYPIYFSRVMRLSLLLVILLLVGSVFNGLWSCSVYGRFYFSHDYVFDFTPVWPISIADRGFGRGALYGISIFELQLLWLLFAAATWSITILIYRIVTRRIFPALRPVLANRSEQQ